MVFDVPEIALEDSLRAVGLDPSGATPGGEKAIPESPHEALGAIQATNAVVVDTDTIRLALTVGDEAIATIPLGSADADRLARDLLIASCRRSGRPGGA